MKSLMKGMSAEWSAAIHLNDCLIRIGGEPVIGLSMLACRARLIGPQVRTYSSSWLYNIITIDDTIHALRNAHLDWDTSLYASG